ncbi:MAG: hypothetical protein HY786_02875 [Deltaproteobacteria bacterium]|nr:hypothetical protein [Deltaproteobacteria bacterium]
MQTKTVYEEKILKEVQGLPHFQQERLAKIFHLLKEEIVSPAAEVRKERPARKLTVYKCDGKLRDFSREDAYAKRI